MNTTINRLTICCSVYCSIYRYVRMKSDNHEKFRKKESDILTQQPLLAMYGKQHDNNLIIKNINVEHDMMFYLRMVRGNLISFENLYLLVEYYSKKNDNLEILLNCDVDINIRDKNGSTILIVACQDGNYFRYDGNKRHNKNTIMIEKLIDAGCDLDIKNYNMKSALLWASHIGYTKIVEKLINARCALDVQDGQQYTSLMLASRGGYTEIVGMLICAKCMINTLNNFQRTALMSASIEGHTEIIGILINAGCMLDIKNFEGYTALSLASLCGHTEIVKKLICAKSKPDIKNIYGKTALDIAKIRDNQQIIDMLMTAMKKK